MGESHEPSSDISAEYFQFMWPQNQKKQEIKPMV